MSSVLVRVVFLEENSDFFSGIKRKCGKKYFSDLTCSSGCRQFKLLLVDNPHVEL